MIAQLTGRLVRAATAPAYRRFRRCLSDPQGAQERVLREIVRDASQSRYGGHHGLQGDDGVAEFREKVPVVTYDDIRPWVERSIFDAEPGVLTSHPVVRVEATSGSSSGMKWIPYTRPMMATFSRMFTLWAHDLLGSVYRPRTGQLFLCVTGGRPDDGSLPYRLVGDDRDYLGKRWRGVLGRFVVAPQFARHADPLECLGETLARAGGLEVMSFWSPSLLVAVLDHLGVDGPEDARRLWPHLQVISCWTAASSALFMGRLRALFPGVHFQGKGLLATEGALTIPLQPDGACLPLLQDVYLEFVEDGQAVRGLHELEEGRAYEVLVTNRSGFLRYRIGDRVRVTGRRAATPVLEFIGRAGIVSDLVGEKITAEFVDRALSPSVGGYFCLLPSDDGYHLWIDAGHRAEVQGLDAVLCRNFHYARARRFGQLAPLVVHELPGLAEQVRRAIEGDGAVSGSRAFKPPLLVADREKAERIRRELQRRLPARKG